MHIIINFKKAHIVLDDCEYYFLLLEKVGCTFSFMLILSGMKKVFVFMLTFNATYSVVNK